MTDRVIDSSNCDCNYAMIVTGFYCKYTLYSRLLEFVLKMDQNGFVKRGQPGGIF